MDVKMIESFLQLVQQLGTPENIAFVKQRLEIDVKDKEGNGIIDKVAQAKMTVEEAVPFFQARFKGSDPLVLFVEYENKPTVEKLGLLIDILNAIYGVKSLGYKPKFNPENIEHWKALRNYVRGIFRQGKGEASENKMFLEFLEGLPVEKSIAPNTEDF